MMDLRHDEQASTEANYRGGGATAPVLASGISPSLPYLLPRKSLESRSESGEGEEDGERDDYVLSSRQHPLFLVGRHRELILSVAFDHLESHAPSSSPPERESQKLAEDISSRVSSSLAKLIDHNAPGKGAEPVPVRVHFITFLKGVGTEVLQKHPHEIVILILTKKQPIRVQERKQKGPGRFQLVQSGAAHKGKYTNFYLRCLYCKGFHDASTKWLTKESNGWKIWLLAPRERERKGSRMCSCTENIPGSSSKHQHGNNLQPGGAYSSYPHKRDGQEGSVETSPYVGRYRGEGGVRGRRSYQEAFPQQPALPHGLAPIRRAFSPYPGELAHHSSYRTVQSGHSSSPPLFAASPHPQAAHSQGGYSPYQQERPSLSSAAVSSGQQPSSSPLYRQHSNSYGGDQYYQDGTKQSSLPLESYPRGRNTDDEVGRKGRYQDPQDFAQSRSSFLKRPRTELSNRERGDNARYGYHPYKDHLSRSSSYFPSPSPSHPHPGTWVGPYPDGMERSRPEERNSALFLSSCSEGDLSKVQTILQDFPEALQLSDDKGGNGLMLAAAAGQHHVISFLLKDGRLSPSIADTQVENALHKASRKGHAVVVQLLLDDGRVDPMAINDKGETALHAACWTGDYETVKLILSDPRVSPAVQDNRGRTPLHIAADFSYESIVMLLLYDGRVDPNVMDNNGQTALHSAVLGNGHLKSFVSLLSDPRVLPSLPDKSGHTPLHYACLLGLEPIVDRLLRDERVDMKREDARGESAFHKTLTLWGSSSGSREKEMAVRIFHRLLADRRADPSTKNSFGHNALHMACALGAREIVEMLLRSAALSPTQRDTNGYSPFQLAAINGRVETVDWLLIHLDLLEEAEEESTVLHKICRLGLSPPTSSPSLLKYGGEMGGRGASYHRYGPSPSSAASSAHSLAVERVFQLILRDGRISPARDDSWGQTPLLIAAQMGLDPLLLLLLSDNRVDPGGHIDKLGETALHKACYLGHVSTVQVLLRDGRVERERRNFKGEKALDIALKHNHQMVVELLMGRDDGVRTEPPASAGMARYRMQMISPSLAAPLPRRRPGSLLVLNDSPRMYGDASLPLRESPPPTQSKTLQTVTSMAESTHRPRYYQGNKPNSHIPE